MIFNPIQKILELYGLTMLISREKRQHLSLPSLCHAIPFVISVLRLYHKFNSKTHSNCVNVLLLLATDKVYGCMYSLTVKR